MAILQVQSATFTASAGGTISVPFAQASVTGNLLLLAYMNFSGGANSPAAPSGWTQVNANLNGFVGNSNGAAIALYYRLNAPSASSVSVVTNGNGNQIGYWSMTEWSGVAAYEGGNIGGSSGTGTPSASYSTTNAGDLVYIISATTGSTPASNGASFTSINPASQSSFSCFADAYEVASGTGAITGQWTGSFTGWVANISAFTAASAGGGGTTSHLLGMMGCGL